MTNCIWNKQVPVGSYYGNTVEQTSYYEVCTSYSRYNTVRRFFQHRHHCSPVCCPSAPPKQLPCDCFRQLNCWTSVSCGYDIRFEQGQQGVPTKSNTADLLVSWKKPHFARHRLWLWSLPSPAKPLRTLIFAKPCTSMLSVRAVTIRDPIHTHSDSTTNFESNK